MTSHGGPLAPEVVGECLTSETFAGHTDPGIIAIYYYYHLFAISRASPTPRSASGSIKNRGLGELRCLAITGEDTARQTAVAARGSQGFGGDGPTTHNSTSEQRGQ